LVVNGFCFSEGAVVSIHEDTRESTTGVQSGLFRNPQSEIGRGLDILGVRAYYVGMNST